MKRSTIHFTVELDADNVPETILWEATDKPDAGPSPTRSISLALWDHEQKSTLRIDLWTKDMPVDDMKRFYIDCIGGLAQSASTATGDQFLVREMHALCERLAQHVKNSKES